MKVTKRSTLLFLFLITLMSFLDAQKKSSDNKITKSEIRKTDDGYRIYLNGEPFFIQGAGVHQGSIASLAEHGANALRTWSTENAIKVLDQAHELNLKVMMGIWVGLERHGFDYDNAEAVKNQLESIRKKVKKLRNHPALMIWGIGNEMNLQSQNPKVWDAVNDISELIHKLDPNHLTTSPLAGLDKELVELIGTKAPDLDFISTQLYGPMDQLPEIIKNSTYEGPLLVTEWGATGYWEVDKTSWDAPLENHSSKKADLYLSRYQNGIASQSQVMGSFVFLWGQKQERTPTWFGMFMPDGKETESVDMMHYAWNGEWPANRTPRLHDFTLDGKQAAQSVKLKAGETYKALVNVSDPDNDPLNYIWEVRRESVATQTGGDAEYIPATIRDSFTNTVDGKADLIAPSRKGAYRLFITVEDGQNHAAHANIPFWVE